MKYFIADTHFAHESLIMNFPRHRPGTKELFASIEEHDQYLLDAINLRVRREDELFILGDFAWKKPGKYRQQINCRHVSLIRGNHDKPGVCKNVFGEVPYVRNIKIRATGDENNTHLNVVLCHTPMAFWDGSHRGSCHLYGHCHGQREVTLNRALGWHRRSFDAGVDNLVKMTGGFSPIDEDEVYALFISLTGHDDPTFYDNHQAMRKVD